MTHLGGEIGGGCTGGFLFLCFVIYMLYRLLIQERIQGFLPMASNMKAMRIKMALVPTHSLFDIPQLPSPALWSRFVVLLERNDLYSHFLIQRKILC